MNLQERVARLEREVDHLRAIVDGGEMQQREAIAVTIGLLVSFAARYNGLDMARLSEFLSVASEPEPSRDDRTAMLLHGVRLILAFHQDLGAETSEPVATTPLPPGEARVILRRAKASVDFERDVRPPVRGTTRTHGSRRGSGGTSH